MNKLRKKGKLKEYKEIKHELLKEMKHTDALGVDVEHTSKLNNEIIKEVLNIYFQILKNKSGTSPLIKSVFLGLPLFT
jgi:hypothetical protein